MNSEERLHRTNGLLTAISNAQSRFISKVDTRVLFDELLKDLLSLTESEYGIIGEVRHDDDGRPFLKAHAVTNFKRNDSIHGLYEKHFVDGVEFSALKSIYGAVMTTGQPVISNSPTTDPRRCGPPSGHPALNAFLGIPFYLGDKLIGMVGIANRAGGYDGELVDYLKPFLSTCAHIIEAHNVAKDYEQAVEALRASEAGLAEAQRIARLGSWSRDLLKNEHYWSDGIRSILGLDKTAKPGADGFLRYVHPDDRASVEATIEDAYNARRGYELEYRVVLRDGSQKTVLEQAEITASPSGDLQKAVGTLQDITERKRLEEELRKVQRLESLGLLAGGIAHDFNNILTAIVGNIHVAAECQAYEERKRVLLEAEKSALRASDLTQQLLTFSKGGAPVRRSAHIGELVKTTAEFALRGSNVRCDFSAAQGLWPVYVDAAQIAQVINNMVINARQAMPDGGAVTIKAENVLLHEPSFNDVAPGPFVRISIADEGHGIPNDLLQKIFDPYFTTKAGGSGLGLASSFSIVKKHKGHIDVFSEPLRGTSFDVYLPASAELPEEEPKSAGLQRGSGRILVIDDEEAIRDILAEVLQSLGYKVVVAEDADRGIEAFNRSINEAKRFDAVILDLTLPGSMGGKEILSSLKQLDPLVKAIASSGYSNAPVMAEHEKHGFRGVVAKPYRIEELSRVVYSVINNGKAR